MVQEIQKGSIVLTAGQQDEFSNVVGFLFDVVQEHAISITNQITDNYLENNTAIQDHIAQAPITINLRGLAGELVYTAPSFSNFLSSIGFKNTAQVWDNEISQLPKPAMEKLKAIPALYPPVSNVTQQAKNVVQKIEVSATKIAKIVKNLFDKKDITRLEEVYQRFMLWRTSNTALRVYTPYKTFDNMFIQSVSLRQGEQNYITDIELSLKQIQYAKVTVTKPDKNVMATYNAMARTQEANHGTAQGKTVDKSIAYKTFGHGAKAYRYQG